MSVAALLFDLQILDLELDALQARQAALEAAMGEPAELQAKRAATAEAERLALQARATLADSELDLGRMEERIAAEEKKLYSGTIRGTKELMGLQKEVESLKRQKAKQEDRILALMEQVEEKQAVVTSRQEEQARTEAAWQAEQARLAAELSTLKGHVAIVSQRRNALAAQVNVSILTTYEELRRAKAGRAVARLEGASCMGCGVILASGEAQHARMRAGVGLAFCTNCGRILYAGR